MDRLQVLDHRGHSIDVPSLWRTRRILLVFLRHFGCRFCKQQVQSLKAVASRLREAGTDIVLISLGTPGQISRFREEMQLTDEMEIYVDSKPDAPVAHAAFKLRSSHDLVANPSTQALGQKALDQGFTDGGYGDGGTFTSPVGPYTGDVFQIGGVFILGEGNLCEFAFRSKHAGDHPTSAAILEAVTGVSADGAEIMYPATGAWLHRLRAENYIHDAHMEPRGGLAPSGLQAGLLCLAVALVCAGGYALADAPPPPPPPPPSGPLSAMLQAFGKISGEAPEPQASVARHAAAAPVAAVASVLAVAAAAAAVLVRFLRQLRWLPSTASRLPNASSVRLFDPNDIDELAIERQLVSCNCGRVTDATDMEKTYSEFTEEELVGIDTLATLDALGSMSFSDAPAIGAHEKCPISNPDVHQLRLANCYMREFLAKPHPLLGRAGPTCPFVPKALKLSSLRIAVIRSGPMPLDAEMRALVRGFIPIFENLPPRDGPTAVYKALLLLFPDVPLSHANRVIDGTQAALKEEFVARGLMLGEFHLANNASGLHNSRFFPLRTVSPTLAIRHMVPQDLVFLTGEQYPPQRRIAFLRSYVAKMANKKGAKAQDDLMYAREQLRLLEASEN
jgi:peroxiredoxin